jgi:hypothetical protein
MLAERSVVSVESAQTTFSKAPASRFVGSVWPVSDQRYSSGSTKTHLFHRVLNDVPNDLDWPRLTITLCATNRLGFDAWIPLWLHDKNAICCSQVQPEKISRCSVLVMKALTHMHQYPSSSRAHVPRRCWQTHRELVVLRPTPYLHLF